MRAASLWLVGLACCTATPAPPTRPLLRVPAVPPPLSVVDASRYPEAREIPPPPPPQLDPDGNDDPVDTGVGTVPTDAQFHRVGLATLALERICDLTPFEDALSAAHANQPLGTDGATVTRYSPIAEGDVARGKSPFKVAFDWNRPGEPSNGGGAGQGFLRVHAIDGRLFVADSDPPYNGFGISEGGTEGYVFISDAAGQFARATGEQLHPPGLPTPDGRAGASVLSRAYHVLDVGSKHHWR